MVFASSVYLEPCSLDICPTPSMLQAAVSRGLLDASAEDIRILTYEILRNMFGVIFIFYCSVSYNSFCTMCRDWYPSAGRNYFSIISLPCSFCTCIIRLRIALNFLQNISHSVMSEVEELDFISLCMYDFDSIAMTWTIYLKIGFVYFCWHKFLPVGCTF